MKTDLSEKELRLQLTEISHILAEKEFLTGADWCAHGNVSVRIPHTNQFLIKPTGMDSGKMKPEEAIKCDLNMNVLSSRSNQRPSRETDVHSGIYQARDDVGAIVHHHSKFAIIISTANKPIIPWSTEGLCLKGVHIVPLLELERKKQVQVVVDAIGEGGRACIIRSHGSFCIGKDLEDAKNCALETEYAAMIQYYACQLESAKPLSLTYSEEILGEPFLITY